EGQAVQTGGVESVHGGPAVGTVPDVRGRALVAREADQDGNEPVVAFAVDRGAGSHDRRPDTAGGERLGHRLGAGAWMGGRGGIDRVVLGHHAARLDERGPGRDDEWAV